MARAIARGETKLTERKESKARVYYKVRDPDRVDGLEWLFLDAKDPGALSLEKAFEEDANLIVEVFGAKDEADLEDMPTVFFGWAYLQVQHVNKKDFYNKKPTGKVIFADM
ncbi:MAG: hypothetical protein H6739_38640 [Alphaproteobacteria bacterium]|nr:hypothetical protein [Alphaproteobacteria bacterium]